MTFSQPFNVGDKVVGVGHPYDNQIEQMAEVAESQNYKHRSVPHTVTEVKKMEVHGCSGQWIKVGYGGDWIDAAWFRKA